MKHTSRNKMTLDGLGRSMQRQFLDARKEMYEMRSTILNEMRVIIEVMREHNRKVLESNDKLVTRFDALLETRA